MAEQKGRIKGFILLGETTREGDWGKQRMGGKKNNNDWRVSLCLSAGSCRSSSCEGSPCARSSTRSSSPPAGSPAPNTTTLLTTAAPAARRRTSLSSGTTRWVVPDRWQKMDLDSLFCSFLVLPVKSSLVQSHLKLLFVFLKLQVDCWYTNFCKQKSRDRTGSFLLNIEYSGSTLSHEIVVLSSDCWLYVDISSTSWLKEKLI